MKKLEEDIAFVRSLLKPDTGKLQARATFHDQMADLFNIDELHQICFDLDVRFDAIPGETVGEKTRELYLYMERRGDLYRLVRICQQERPSANWIIT